MANEGINRSISIAQPNIFGRIGSGIGKGLAESLPKEIERGRLASGLQQLSQQKGLSPFQQFAGLVSTPGATPQIVESGTNLLRQQAIIDSTNRNNDALASSEPYNVFSGRNEGTPSATTTESTDAALNPYIPPSGPEQETMARRLMAAEPQVYPNIESARQAVASQVAGNQQQSNAKLGKRELEESVQNASEKKLRDELATVGANIPGTLLSRLQQKAVDDVTNKRLSPDQAKVKYGKIADDYSRNFANIRSWGGLGLVATSPSELLPAISQLQKDAKKGNFQKEAADSMIGENLVTPQFAYASMYPVSDIPKLNDELNSLPEIKKNKGQSGFIPYSKFESLSDAMGLTGSPLSVAYELEKKGYDPRYWKKYLSDSEHLNLSDYQRDELKKPQPGYFGLLNDWWLKAFTGVK